MSNHHYLRLLHDHANDDGHEENIKVGDTFLLLFIAVIGISVPVLVESFLCRSRRNRNNNGSGEGNEDDEGYTTQKLKDHFEENQVQTMLCKDDFDLHVDENVANEHEQNDIEICGVVKLPRRVQPQSETVPNTCAICLACYEQDETIVWSSNKYCQHAYHQTCFLDYAEKARPKLKGEPPYCPCCRQPFLNTTNDSDVEKANNDDNDNNDDDNGSHASIDETITGTPPSTPPPTPPRSS